MLNWFKRKKAEKQLKKAAEQEFEKNLAALKNMILEIDLPEKASAKEVDAFYETVSLWKKILAEKSFEFDVFVSKLSRKDKEMLLVHIRKCMSIYGSIMISLNDNLIEYLNATNISSTTKANIAAFGKENIAKSDETLNVLKELAQHIATIKE